jgi:putative drug exporter of the RND superfamily
VAFANVHMDGEQPIADVPKSAYDKLIDTAEAARGDGLQVELGGSGIQQAGQQQGGGPSEFIGSSRQRSCSRSRSARCGRRCCR